MRIDNSEKSSGRKEKPPINGIGAELRRIRKNRKIILKDAAERIGLSEGYLARLERGEQRFSNEQINALADLYGVPVNDLTEKAGISDPRTRYLPVESIRYYCSCIAKDPLIQGALYLPRSLEGEALTICIFQARYGRQWLSPTETRRLMEWLGLSDSAELNVPEFAARQIFSALRNRDSEQDVLDDVRQVLEGSRQWRFNVWMARANLPVSNPTTSSPEMSRLSVEDRRRLRQEGMRDLIRWLGEQQTFVEAAEWVNAIHAIEDQEISAPFEWALDQAMSGEKDE